MASERLKARGMMAAIAYIGHIGMAVLSTEYKTMTQGTIPIVALDGHTIVHVSVHIGNDMVSLSTPAKSTIRRYRRQMAEYLQAHAVEISGVRYDHITIRVFEKDKAILRHHRDIEEV